MLIEIIMPKVGESADTGKVVRWRVQPGSRIRKGDVLAEVETETVFFGVRATSDGQLSAITAAQGKTVLSGEVLGMLETQEVASSGSGNEGLLDDDGGDGDVSPAARRLAAEHDIDLRKMRGSGPEGRIVLADVERALGQKDAGGEGAPHLFGLSREGSGGGKSVRVRRLVARKMIESWETVPHFYVTIAVDMTDIIRFRKDLGVSINDFILAASARALEEHPWVNCYCLDGEAVEQSRINIAMAVATDRGLYNPVVKDCSSVSLKSLSRRAGRLAALAHSGRLKQADLEEGTFTISNMGMLGVESFSALITPPQVAALAVGTIRGEVVIDEHEELLVAPILRLTLSADHRVLDGADAAEFLDTVKSYLEAPVILISAEGGKEH